MEHKEFLEAYYGSLKGARIVGVSLVPDEYDDQLWPRISVVLSDGSGVTLEVSRDEEGNGPGFLFGLPIPQEATRA